MEGYGHRLSEMLRAHLARKTLQTADVALGACCSDLRPLRTWRCPLRDQQRTSSHQELLAALSQWRWNCQRCVTITLSFESYSE